MQSDVFCVHMCLKAWRYSSPPGPQSKPGAPPQPCWEEPALVQQHRHSIWSQIMFIFSGNTSNQPYNGH